MDPRHLEVPRWTYFLGPPLASGIIRSRPEDFYVEEIPRITPAGEGKHLWLWVEKRAANTDWIARELSLLAGCPHRDVGYAGLKDRHAVTRQWFSVPETDVLQQGLEDVRTEGLRILETRNHTRKLKRGALNGNRFKLRIRQFEGDSGELTERLEQIRLHGVPNYFGPQRFGHQGRNVQQGFNILSKRARVNRNKRSIYLSALRSFLFNQVLAERVRRGDWHTILDGELAMLDGSQSIFACEMPDKDLEERCKRLDIHPTGPLPGAVVLQPKGSPALLERQVLQQWTELTELLVSHGVKASRRALRLYPADLDWQLQDGDLELAFTLPPGAYATTLLREVLVNRGPVATDG